MKRVPKLLCLALAVFLPFYSIAAYVNPGQCFRLDLTTLDLITTIDSEESNHIVGYGVDIKKAESFYMGLRTMLGATYVNRKVYIYRANPKYPDGQIGEEAIHGIKYYGAYKKDVITGRDVIVYNGSDETLTHELVHFFYNHMNSTHADEDFAYITTAYLMTLDQQARLLKVIKLIVEMNRIHRETPTKEVTNV